MGGGREDAEREAISLGIKVTWYMYAIDQPGLSVSVQTYSSVFTGRCAVEYANTYVACQRTSYTQLAAYKIIKLVEAQHSALHAPSLACNLRYSCESCWLSSDKTLAQAIGTHARTRL